MPPPVRCPSAAGRSGFGRSAITFGESGLASIVGIDGCVFGHTPRAWWLTIPAETLDFGEDLSPKAQRGFAEAIAKIEDDLTTPLACRSWSEAWIAGVVRDHEGREYQEIQMASLLRDPEFVNIGA
mgnify:CR=1 FL=1